MPITIRNIQDSDFKTVTGFLLRSFDDDAFNHVMYPWRESPEGLEIAEHNLRMYSQKDSRNHFIVAVDEESQEVAAMAVWAIFDENPWRLDGDGKGVNAYTECKWLDQWPKPEYRQYGEWVLNSHREKRKSLTACQGPHCYLSLLATNPKFYRRGAGTSLIKYGTDIADKNGWPCAVESSPYAAERRVYHKFGFEEVERMVFDDRQRFPDLDSYWNLLMVRPVQVPLN